MPLAHAMPSCVVPGAAGLPLRMRHASDRVALPAASGSGWYLKAGNDMRSPSVRMAGKHAIPMRTDIVPQHERATAIPRR
ncbi:hypothetical protein WT24_06940 [Burkholderia sp. MSMB1078WGS]|nr:hypothetical protein WT24_06940 [Burkholderia sp. MSMB1078WGS]